MGWGTMYKHTGYLSHVYKHEIDGKYDDCQRINDMIWREILAYMSQTPPAMMTAGEGEEYPWPEFIAMKVNEYRHDLEENIKLMAQIDECRDVMAEHPDDVYDS